MPPEIPFKIIIAGGGVAGLALANMLEEFHVDYILLESHANIAASVGASIGLFPNGMRILDQIGCYEAIEALPQVELRVGYTRDSQGKTISVGGNLPNHLKSRFGYSMRFFDRTSLLQILHEKLTHKDRVLTGKKVVAVQHLDDAVSVTTQDGDVFEGSMLLGADGVHSAVRREMLRLAGEEHPGYFPPDVEDTIPCYYKCSYGIAQHVPGWVEDEQHIVTGKGMSQLVCGGPEGKVYWFLFVQLPSAKYGKDIPSYTREDEAAFAKEHTHLPITENVTWGQLYENRISSTLTPLHEYVFPKWFYKRILCLGDSVHKPNPIGGQGGNGALESMAEFVNAIIETRDSRPEGLSSLNIQDITDIFSRTQAARFQRAQIIVRVSHNQQALTAYEKPLLSWFVWRVVAPRMGDEMTYNLISAKLTGAARLRDLPLPKRARSSLFDDELPAKPLRGLFPQLVTVVYAGFMGYLALHAWRQPPFSPSPPLVGPLGTLCTVAQFLGPQLIFTLESHRIGNRGNLLSVFPYIAGPAIQAKRFNVVAPSYSLLSALVGNKTTMGRFVKPTVARALIPALAVGYALPKLGLPFLTAMGLGDSWAALICKHAPVVPLLNSLLASKLERNGAKSEQVLQAQPRVNGPCENGEKSHLNDKPGATEKEVVVDDTGDCSHDRFTTKDVPILQITYASVFAIQAAARVATLVNQTPHLMSLSSMPFSLTDIGTISVVMNNVYSVWDLRRLGYITTKDAVIAALGVVASQPLAGTGATWVLLWCWRERIIALLRQD